MLNATLWINLSDLVMSRKNQIRSIYDQFICESRTDKTDQRWKGVSIWYTVERWEHQLRNNMRETSVKGILRCSRVPVCVLSQSCLTLCNLMDCNPQDSSVHRIFQARILEWITVTFFMRSPWPRDQIWVITLLMDSLTSELPGKLMRIIFSGGNRVT